MNIILFDDHKRSDLLPLCFTRPCGELRVGIFTLSEKWKNRESANVSFLTQDYLQDKYPAKYTKDNFYINGRIVYTKSLADQIKKLEVGESIVSANTLVALRSHTEILSLDQVPSQLQKTSPLAEPAPAIDFCYDIFQKTGTEIVSDFDWISSNRKSATLSNTNTLIGDNIFAEEGAVVEAAVINTKNGPVYIGKNAEIMEGAVVRGPLSLGEGSSIKMGAKIYGDTSIGPMCKIGGEVTNSVFYANSNKGHDGFLGNSVIGEWCNIGADTNSSNLKNNYAAVKLWNYTANRFVDTGLQFCGLIMGDHSKCGINTMFNTGTVVGVSANIFGAAFPRNFIPSFTWGGASGFATYTIAKALETGKIVMARRKKELNNQEQEILESIYSQTEEARFWEKKTTNI